MLTLYIFCAVIGGGLILLSAFGRGDHEHGADADHYISVHDVAHDFDHGGLEADHGAEGSDHGPGHDGPFIPFFSLRFWTYFIGIFGGTGLLLSLLTQTPEPATGLWSAGTGMLSGLVAASLVRWISRHEADSTARDSDMLGLRAKVTVPIREQQLGRIRTTVKGELLDILATAEEKSDLIEGTEVVIVGMDNGRASVMPLDTLLEENK
ncbi:MAG TPA: NfeD family protein [Fimbriimonadaceae bacterium]|nr:NfeD family protein [Fimbriimonadaceae bacterium]